MEDCAMEARDMYPEAEEENRPWKQSDAEDKEEEEEETRGGGGGILNNLLANLVAPTSPRAPPATIHSGDKDPEVGSEEREDVAVPAMSEEGDDEESSGNGSGGIIDSIVSHLPKSLPEDVAPTNDEASILIHAIVHD